MIEYIDNMIKSKCPHCGMTNSNSQDGSSGSFLQVCDFDSDGCEETYVVNFYFESKETVKIQKIVPEFIKDFPVWKDPNESLPG